MDWALAWAIRDEEPLAGLRTRLLGEILSSMNEDFSFGRFDVPLSTASAILSLAALDHRDRTLRLAQLRLSEFMYMDSVFPESTPFYSTYKIPFPSIPSYQDGTRVDAESEQYAGQSSSSEQIAQFNDQPYAISFYIDSYRTNATAAKTSSPSCSDARQG